jgi:NTE family protein
MARKPRSPNALSARRDGFLTNVAFQGGGSHGAFAWGVLDRLLEEDDLSIPGVVGTSAGAMNAVLLAAGLAQAGRDGARDLLRAFWTRVSNSPSFRLPGPGFPFLPDGCAPAWPGFQNAGWVAVEMWSCLFSPYQFNPLDLNPLRDILRELVDFGALRAGGPKLFLCATNVLTGKLRIFDRSEIEAEHVLASACLPTLFQAVRIGDQYYWDGGYMGNPPIFPVIYNTDCRDVMIIQINPIAIERLPTSPSEIADRMNTLSFNSSLQRELRAIHFVSQLVEEGHLDPQRFKRLNVHVVQAEDVMRGLGAHSKFDTSPTFIQSLHALGRERMTAWLAANRTKVGRESSVDLAAGLQ